MKTAKASKRPADTTALVAQIDGALVAADAAALDTEAMQLRHAIIEQGMASLEVLKGVLATLPDNPTLQRTCINMHGKLLSMAVQLAGDQERLAIERQAKTRVQQHHHLHWSAEQLRRAAATAQEQDVLVTESHEVERSEIADGR